MTTQQKRRYALLAGLGLALVAFLVVRGRSGGEAADLVAAGPVGSTPLDGGGGGASDGGADLASFVDLVDERIQGHLAGVTAELGEQRGNMGDLEDFVKGWGATLNEDTWAAPDDIDPDWLPPTVEPDLSPTGQALAAAPGNTKAAAAAAGFYWNVGGKRTLVTTKNVAAFKAELKRDRVNVDEWARKHPQAAKKVGIKVKKPKKAGGGGRGSGVGSFLSTIVRPRPPAPAARVSTARTSASRAPAAGAPRTSAPTPSSIREQIRTQTAGSVDWGKAVGPSTRGGGSSSVKAQ